MEPISRYVHTYAYVSVSVSVRSLCFSICVFFSIINYIFQLCDTWITKFSLFLTLSLSLCFLRLFILFFYAGDTTTQRVKLCIVSGFYIHNLISNKL